ncbi:MAG: hypothetical protein AB1746_09500 [Candidatus Zixiibacteriota bacterium]
MKQYSHAWLAFKAVERLKKAKLKKDLRKYADGLAGWFGDHKDDVMQGAWYPDEVIKDMATSHVYKMTPVKSGRDTFRELPKTYKMFAAGKTSSLYKKPFSLDTGNNLPDRCESIAHSIIDNLKMLESEHKGSPVVPTDNHITLRFFMLSHYVADAHVPFHSDSRQFSKGKNIHGHVEGLWDKEIAKYYQIDKSNERFFYNPEGFPLFKDDPKHPYSGSFLSKAEDEVFKRDFPWDYGKGNNNIWDFMYAVCQFSYLMSYDFIPKNYNQGSVTKKNLNSLKNQKYDFETMSAIMLADAVDSIARVWLHIWRRHKDWEAKQRKKKTN